GILSVEDLVLWHDGHDLDRVELAGFGLHDILALVQHLEGVKSILKKAFDDNGVSGISLRQVHSAEIKKTPDHIADVPGCLIILRLFEFAGLIVEYLDFYLTLFVIKIGPFVFLVPAFTDPAIELMGYQSGGIDICAPMIVHIGNPVD